MKLLKNGLELYVNSSLHVALAIVAFTIITYLEYDLAINPELIGFVFFSSITGYNFVKYAGIAKLHHLSLAGNLRLIQIFSLLSFLALIYFSFQMRVEVLIATAVLGVLTLFYAVPILGNDRNLRSLPGLKIFIIAVVWAGSSVLLPMIAAMEVLGGNLIVDFLQRLTLVLVLTLPFEIRDLNFDSEALGTIPQKLGVGKTKIFGTILIGIIFLTEMFQWNFSSVSFVALSFTLILTIWLLWKARVEQTKYYSSFWVEAIPIFYLGIFLAMKCVDRNILF
ncbi:hypothetical protein [Christiangramia aquimixticola]|uniref:hypothetical protein n=1 Tax=Christiangramia aquimixticola TaxID=1697558 RepID=UPI003AA88DEC